MKGRVAGVVSLLVSALMFACASPRSHGAKRGVDLGVVNHVTQEFILKVRISSDSGKELAAVSLPIQRSASGKEWRYLDDTLTLKFDRLAVEAVLVSVPYGVEVGRAAALWPGGAGTSACASCNRILVVLQIRSVEDGSVELVFDEGGFI